MSVEVDSYAYLHLNHLFVIAFLLLFAITPESTPNRDYFFSMVHNRQNNKFTYYRTPTGVIDYETCRPTNNFLYRPKHQVLHNILTHCNLNILIISKTCGWSYDKMHMVLLLVDQG